MSFLGLFTALATPFDQEGKLDETGFRNNLRVQVDAKVDGFVVVGTTGESCSLSHKEKERLIKIAREESRHIPLMVGCGMPSTSQSLEMLKLATDLGADVALVISPLGNQCTQDGLLKHYELLARHTELPLVVYNNPSRTASNIEVQTLKKIAEFPNVIGVKDSPKNLQQICDIIYEIKSQNPDFMIYCGDDALILPTLALGADGAISGTANLIPVKMREFIWSVLEKNVPMAQKLHLELWPLFKALSFESNPIPLKAAMKLLGLAGGDPRLPLTPLSNEYIPKLEKVLEDLGLLHLQTL